MADHAERIRSLESQIMTLETQLQALRSELAYARSPSVASRSRHTSPDLTRSLTRVASNPDPYLEGAIAGGLMESYHSEILSALQQPTSERPDEWPLGQVEYKRYGRQLIMPEIGLDGQMRLKRAKVLIVGVGGLGCPAAAYLAGAGVGTLGLVDGDEVEESNLHRQILHRKNTLGWRKVDSAIVSLKEMNPLVEYIPHTSHLSPENALHIISNYDIVLDCTDTPASRYLISDACVLLGKPLVSASALRIDGQLMLLNYPAKPPGEANGGPCYRCIFPKPPPAESVVSCGEGGILGPVVGVMGVLQAFEAIKLITAETSTANSARTLSSPFSRDAIPQPSLLIFSGYSSPQFRSIKLRSRSPRCAVCSAQASITAQSLLSGSMDYVQFCGVAHPINLLNPSERISAYQYGESRKQISLAAKPHLIIDVREKVQYDLCHLFGSLNIPFSRIIALSGQAADHDTLYLLDEVKEYIGRAQDAPVLVVCRLGNDSQIAVKKFKELGLAANGQRWIGDIVGGLKAWRTDVDPNFPDY